MSGGIGDDPFWNEATAGDNDFERPIDMMGDMGGNGNGGAQNTNLPDSGVDMIGDLAASAPAPAPSPSDFHLVEKGDYFDLVKKVPSLRRIMIGAGWDHKMLETTKIDVDLSCFLLDKQNQTRVDEDFVFYNNESGCDGAVRHSGDSRTGAGDGDDESLFIDLNGLPFDVLRVMITVSIYNAAEAEQHLGMVRNIYLRIVNEEDGNEIVRLQMDESMLNGVAGMQVACLVREGPKWYLEVLENPVKGGLGAIATQYGIIVGAGA